jgi:hypothetical protein
MKYAALLTISLASLVNAESITVKASTSCALDISFTTGTGPCQLRSDFGSADASYEYNFQLLEFGFTAEARANAFASLFDNPGADDLASHQALASASLDMQFFFRTAGPERPGRVVAAYHSTSDPLGSGSGSASLLFEPALEPVLFTLGGPFSIGVSVSGEGRSSQPLDSNGGSGVANLELRLFEEDGTTPVLIVWNEEFDPTDPSDPPAVTEPATVLTAGLGTGIALVADRRRRRTQ